MELHQRFCNSHNNYIIIWLINYTIIFHQPSNKKYRREIIVFLNKMIYNSVRVYTRNWHTKNELAT